MLFYFNSLFPEGSSCDYDSFSQKSICFYLKSAEIKTLHANTR